MPGRAKAQRCDHLYILNVKNICYQLQNVWQRPRHCREPQSIPKSCCWWMAVAANCSGSMSTFKECKWMASAVALSRQPKINIWSFIEINLNFFLQVCRLWIRPTAVQQSHLKIGLNLHILSNFLNSLEIKALLNWTASGHHCLSFVLFPPVDSLLTINAPFTSLHGKRSWLRLLFFLSPPSYFPKFIVSESASQLLLLQFASWVTQNESAGPTRLSYNCLC